mgnify:FL=1
MNIDFGMFTREESRQGFISEFLKELEKGLRNMNNEIKEYTIDRLEGNFAVCEDRDTGEMVDFKRDDLPQNAREGSILKYSNGKFEIDSKQEQEVSERIKQKMDNLWNN